MDRCKGLALDESGSTLVEMALSLVLLLMCIFGVADCSRLLYAEHFIASASRQAARYATVRGSSWLGVACASNASVSCMVTSTAVQRYVAGITPSGIRTSLLTVTTTWPGTTATGATCLSNGSASNGPGCIVVVKVSYQFNFVTPLLPKGSRVLTTTSKMTISQ